jgi:dethiobiotin synthetase/adenosylmethionine--8-amino-7-oxononanoate aminotransferase
MFAEAVHEPAFALAEALIEGMRNPRLTRVFFSDNGSTGVEVAVKMALRTARVRYGWDARSKIGIVGLKGSYHGDTMGAMDCSEPSTFNEKVEWYEGKGVWLDSPTILCKSGKWVVEVPEALRPYTGKGQAFASLAGVFDVSAREAKGDHKAYEEYIESVLEHHVAMGCKFGALILEPMVMGAGGMLLV